MPENGSQCAGSGGEHEWLDGEHVGFIRFKIENLVKQGSKTDGGGGQARERLSGLARLSGIAQMSGKEERFVLFSRSKVEKRSVR